MCRAPHWCITRLWIFADKYCTLTNRRTPKKVHARRRLISGRRGVQGACSSRCPGSGPCGVGRSVTADAGGNVTKLDLSGTTCKLESKCLLIEPHYTSDLCCASHTGLPGSLGGCTSLKTLDLRVCIKLESECLACSVRNRAAAKQSSRIERQKFLQQVLIC